MDKSKDTEPRASGHDEAIDPKSAPDNPAAESGVVFYGDAAQVSAGFALALRLMGIDEQVPDASERTLPKKGNLS